MGRHKKNIRAEKAKVKLKGLKLPKGQNVTKTDFKVKKILIREQLKETDASIPGGERKNIKELLPRLKHHNVSIRLDALKSLKGLISYDSDDIVLHLLSLLQGISSLCLDIEKNIRRESFKILGILLSKMKEFQIRPFFNMISTYLSCALTHIQPFIQDDALLMLDVLLKYCPHLVAENDERILRDFLDMISKNSNESKRSNRVLISHLNKNQTSTIWRQKVLERLQELLKALCDLKRSNVKRKELCAVNEFKETELKRKYNFPLIRSYYNGIPKLSGVFMRTTNVSEEILENRLEDEKLRLYVDQLIPLLFDSWIEISPESNQDGHGKEGKSNKMPEDENLLNEISAYTLAIILEIFNDFWELIEIWEEQVRTNSFSTEFRQKYSKKFCQHICNFYPYQTQGGPDQLKERKKKKKNSFLKDIECGEDQCLAQNLNIIYLTCKFLDKDIPSEKIIMEKELDYLIKIITNLDRTKISSRLEKPLRSVLYTYGEELMKTFPSKMSTLLDNFTISCQKNFISKDKSGILQLACDIASKDKLWKSLKLNKMESFLSNLPMLLFTKLQVNWKNINSLNTLGKQKNKFFLEGLKISAKKIITILPDVEILDHPYENADRNERTKSIVNLLYWISDWTVEEKLYLKNYIKETKLIDEELRRYCEHIVEISGTC